MLQLLVLAASSLDTAPAEAWAEATTYGQLDLAEICCTADSILTEEVLRQGGVAKRYSEWNGYSLTKKKDANALLQELIKEQPRHAWFSPPCGPESPMQNANERTPEQRLALQLKRHRVRRIQRHIKYIIAELRRHSPHTQTHVEQPGSCRSWANELAELKADLQRWTAMVDGCAYGLRDEATQMLEKKRWHLNSSDRAFCQHMERRCSGDHLHKIIEGNATALSAGYPRAMARRAAKYFVRKAPPSAVQL